MDVVLCHITADFDTLGAAVGVTRLKPGARIVLTGGSHPGVKDFLALHRDEYALIERRSVNPEEIRSITVVDTQWRDRLGKAAEWLDRANVEVHVYDHHPDTSGDVVANTTHIESVGATSTLIAESLQSQGLALNPIEATVMALGIHVDTGSLTFDHTTVRDAAALTWLMEQGASVRAIAEYVEPGLSPQLQDLLTTGLDTLQSEVVEGLTLSWVLLTVDAYVPGLSSLASQMITLTESDVLLLGARYPVGDGNEERLTIIGRSRGRAFGSSHLESVDLGQLFKPLGGGGHPRAAAVTLRGVSPDAILAKLLDQLRSQIPSPPTARELMSSPVRTIRPETTIAEAQRILLRYGHSGLSVVDASDRLVGVVSRRDLDIALHHNFSHAPVKGFMTTNVKTIAPDTPLPEIESLMVTYDIGRLPVLHQGSLIGIVTRTDVLRQLHQEQLIENAGRASGGRRSPHCLLPDTVYTLLHNRLAAPLWELLSEAANQAEQRGWQLYLVGGAVRDLLLATSSESLLIDDIDLVVDGFHQAADDAAGVELARALRETYASTKLQVHGRFQTAALLWHNDPHLDSLWVDIATARTEFYPYPAANPEVEASSIRQDLYRRDFTINALAIRLTEPRRWELLDFFGGLIDLQAKQIRVLHANSFIEDPTRIFRAVRFAVRLGFDIDAQTESYIRHAIGSGIYHRIQSDIDTTPALQTRLKRELHYILEAPYWQSAIRLLDDLGALQCIHVDLDLDDDLWWQLRLVDRCLRRFDRQNTVPHWQMLLEVMIAELAPEARLSVAQNLQLPAESIERLQYFSQIQAELAQSLPQCDRPSELFQQLNAYDLATLILSAAKGSRSVRRHIWKYLSQWATSQPPLDGNDLKALGYKPSPRFKDILSSLLAAKLDGEITNRAEAEAFLSEHFPLNSA